MNALRPAALRALAVSSLACGIALMAAPAAHAQAPALLIYGNYCGPGNRGPAYPPIDALDLACAHHDACWPAQPGVLPLCSCNRRLQVEAGLVARDARTPPQTRQTAQFISDIAAGLPCE